MIDEARLRGLANDLTRDVIQNSQEPAKVLLTVDSLRQLIAQTVLLTIKIIQAENSDRTDDPERSEPTSGRL